MWPVPDPVECSFNTRRCRGLKQGRDDDLLDALIALSAQCSRQPDFNRVPSL
jgi:hypothetical protein